MPHESHEERVVVERYAESCSVLADPRYLVPKVDSTATSGLDWLRANVSRFCNGADHDRLRAMVEADLARIDTGWLERAAHERTLAELRRPSPAPPGPRERSVRVARAVPVATLASSLGVAEDRLDAVAEAVIAVAAAYHPGSNPDAEVRRRADQGVERLLQLFGRGAPKSSPIGPRCWCRRAIPPPDWSSARSSWRCCCHAQARSAGPSPPSSLRRCTTTRRSGACGGSAHQECGIAACA